MISPYTQSAEVGLVELEEETAQIGGVLGRPEDVNGEIEITGVLGCSDLNSDPKLARNDESDATRTAHTKTLLLIYGVERRGGDPTSQC